jgi:hypothetical protein
LARDFDPGGVPPERDEEFRHDPVAMGLPDDLAAILDRELEPKEKVVWVGQPNELAFVRRSIGIFLFGIPFFVFAIFWTRLAMSSGMGPAAAGGSWGAWFPLLWGGMFVVIGGGMLLSPFWAWWLAQRTLYAVTDRRVLLIEAARRLRVQHFTGERLLNAVRVEDRYGRGDLILERLPVQGRRGRTRFQEVGFFGVDDVRKVERLVRATVERGTGPDRSLPEFLRKS